MPPPTNKWRGRPGEKAASKTRRVGTAVAVDDTRPFRLTTCSSTCPDCYGTGAIGLQPCDRRTQWLHRIGYDDLFGRWAA